LRILVYNGSFLLGLRKECLSKLTLYIIFIFNPTTNHDKGGTRGFMEGMEVDVLLFEDVEGSEWSW